MITLGRISNCDWAILASREGDPKFTIINPFGDRPEGFDKLYSVVTAQVDALQSRYDSTWTYEQLRECLKVLKIKTQRKLPVDWQYYTIIEV